MMATRAPVPLHLASNFEELLKHCEISRNTAFGIATMCELSERVFNEATNELSFGDEEKAFINFQKYHKFVARIREYVDYRDNSFLYNTHYDFESKLLLAAEYSTELRSSLESRYSNNTMANVTEKNQVSYQETHVYIF